jgi:hypothetical protein
MKRCFSHLLHSLQQEKLRNLRILNPEMTTPTSLGIYHRKFQMFEREVCKKFFKCFDFRYLQDIKKIVRSVHHLRELFQNLTSEPSGLKTGAINLKIESIKFDQ